MSRTLSTTANAPPAAGPATGSSTAPTNTALFITNLRLLDLDRLPDWPSIDAHTFSTKDAGQNQKNRIRCVEWALFRLFERWNGEETREKLQPFFPPLEPLQSLNLRAALYRSLNELKKNGALGRETILRKTFLDDCKGEKLMEVLAVFSTNVVKAQCVDGSRSSRNTVTLRLATSPELDRHDQSLLQPLTLAHRASQKALLKQRTTSKAQYKSFSGLLDAKAEELKAREQGCKTKTARNAAADLASIEQQVRDSWLGDSQWADILLHGLEPKGDRFLFQSFGNVWKVASSDQPITAAFADQSLLSRLELRAQQQKRRVAHWRAFHEEMKAESRADLPNASTTAAPPQSALKFDAHKGVNIATRSSEAATDAGMSRAKFGDPPVRNQVYGSILAGMRERLSTAATASREEPSPGRRFSAASIQPQVASPRSRLSASFGALSSPSPPRHKRADSHTAKQVLDSKESPALKLSAPDKEKSVETSNASPLVQQASPQAGEHGEGDDATQTTAGAELGDTHADTTSSPEASRDDFAVSQTTASPPKQSNQQPPPVEHPRIALSLAERTRMSIAHAVPRPDDAEPSAEHEPEPQEEASTALPDVHAAFDRRASLFDRTRQSMSLLPQQGDNSNHPRSRKSLAAAAAKPANKRTSLFPVNQFETPKGKRTASLAVAEADEESSQSNASTPRESLFSDEVDYASVFKSRPKLALSPAFTPQDGSYLPSLDGVADLDESSFVSSPLGRMG